LSRLAAARVPAALAGTADWSEQHEQQMRVGVVHALASTAAMVLYAASVAAPARARALRLAGLTVVTAGGLLGGHLAFRQSPLNLSWRAYQLADEPESAVTIAFSGESGDEHAQPRQNASRACPRAVGRVA
jgi:hypothetical protein